MRSHRVPLGHARAGSSRAWIYARAHSARGTPRLEGLEHTRLEHCRLVSHTMHYEGVEEISVDNGGKKGKGKTWAAVVNLFSISGALATA